MAQRSRLSGNMVFLDIFLVLDDDGCLIWARTRRSTQSLNAYSPNDEPWKEASVESEVLCGKEVIHRVAQFHDKRVRNMITTKHSQRSSAQDGEDAADNGTAKRPRRAHSSAHPLDLRLNVVHREPRVMGEEIGPAFRGYLDTDCDDDESIREKIQSIIINGHGVGFFVNYAQPAPEMVDTGHEKIGHYLLRSRYESEKHDGEGSFWT